jgi:hypothetical protein
MGPNSLSHHAGCVHGAPPLPQPPRQATHRACGEPEQACPHDPIRSSRRRVGRSGGDPGAPITRVCLFAGAAAGSLVAPAGLRPMHPTAARELPADQGRGRSSPSGRVSGARARGRRGAGPAQPQRGRRGRVVPGAGRAGRGARGPRRSARRGGGRLRRRRPAQLRALQGRMVNRAGRRRGRASPTWSSTLCGWTAGCSPACPTPSGGGCWRSWRSPGPPGRRWRRSPGPAPPCWRPPANRAWRGGGRAAAEHLPAGPADQELAQDQALPA